MIKRYVVLLIAILSAIGMNGQSLDYKSIYKSQLLEDVSKELFKADLEDISIYKQFTDDKTGVTHIYLQQNYKGIPIYQAVGAVHIKNGKIAYATNSFISSIKSKLIASDIRISPERAISSLASHHDISDITIGKGVRNSDSEYIFDQVSYTNSPVKLRLLYVLDDNQLKLTWEVQADMKNSDDYWSTKIDVTNGSILEELNYTIYCKYDKADIRGHEGTDEHHHVEDSESRAPGASYRVYPFPAESPLDGVHTLVTDPHIVEASPLGWHDTDGEEGVESTITKGNNVHAYLDKEDDNINDGGEPDGGESLVFDWPHIVDGDPGTNDLSSVVNLFYLNNMMHDLTYILGFDEKSGNFQTMNYSGEGIGNDAVQAQASDGSTLNDPDHLGNANFRTPPDGSFGRMQMYLWPNTGGLFTIDSPADISGIVSEVGTASFGPEVVTLSVSGKVVVADDGTVNNTEACDPLINGDEISGNVALIDRAQCDFSLKVFHAQQAGAVAVIICNIVGVNGGNGEEILSMGIGSGEQTITIPSLFLKKSVCDDIRIALAADDVVVTFEEKDLVGPKLYDGSFDNGVVAHEYGHGVSTRLINPGCLSNEEQMGEGWSDFWTIALTAKVGDQGTMNKGVGNYVTGRSITGRGIRQFPYSTDMSINPLTYDDIKSTPRDMLGRIIPHPIGTVWNSMLFDMYWAFIDQYGFDPDWSNTESGNFKAAHLVIEGLKMTSCSPGFVDARDAILAADNIINEGTNNCMLWEVFARRGLGYYAKQGGTNIVTDGDENFDTKPTCIVSMKIAKEIDGEGTVAPNENIKVRLNVINHIPNTQNNVVVTEDLPDGLTYVENSANFPTTVSGNTITFMLDEMTYEKEKEIEFQLKVNEDLKSNTLLFAGVEEEEADDKWSSLQLNNSSFFEEIEENVYSGLTAWYISDEEADVDAALQYELNVVGENPVLRFWHDYNTQASFDGGYIRISTDGGTHWNLVNDKFIRNGYNGDIAYTTFALPGLQGFTGDSNGFIDSWLDLNEYKGQNIMIQFRFGTDAEKTAVGPNPGWTIDALELIDLVDFISTSCVHSAENTDDICTTGESILLIPNGMVGVDKVIESIKGFVISPNPATKKSILSFDATQQSKASLAIYDISGALMSRQSVQIVLGSNEISLPIQNLSIGQYLVVVKNREGQMSEKLLIVK